MTPRTPSCSLVVACFAPLLVAGCGSSDAPSSTADAASARDLVTQPTDAAPDAPSVDAGCGGALGPLAAAYFGASPHVPGRWLLQLSDSTGNSCDALDGTPSCSCAAPCACYTLQLPLPARPLPGDYALAAQHAQYTVEQADGAGGSSSTTYSLTAGTLHLEAAGAGLAATLCGAVADTVGPLPLTGHFTATSCP